MKSQLFALRKRTLMTVFTILLVAAGILAYENLGRLEDPTFTIKTAVVATAYPGASPAEVEEEVTDLIEEACPRCHVYMTPYEGGEVEIPAGTGHTFEPRIESCQTVGFALLVIIFSLGLAAGGIENWLLSRDNSKKCESRYRHAGDRHNKRIKTCIG